MSEFVVDSMSPFVAESQPSIPGAKVRQALMARGAEIEREWIIGLLEGEEWDAPEVAEPYVRHMVALIRGNGA